MSATDHYAEAERLVSGLVRDGMTIEDLTVTMAAAQVHATLATVQRGMSVGTLSVDLAPADSPGYLSIPWPPSDELVERVVSDVRDVLSANDETYRDIAYATARAVLDVIGAGDE